MSKILIQTSAGELVDKLTILEIKKEKISDTKSLEIIEKEYLSLKKSVKENLDLSDEINNLWAQLRKVNLKLWEIEDDIRLFEKNNSFDEKFIELARSVYKHNDNRAKIKSEINRLTGSDIKEIKQYTKY
ncbi:MAG: hypothetical protein CMG67_01130 [Candidatus Marinimicrobia bacterium]|nr:hypothetical protein [Candidatus Neomarinimicrobiota bacterium]|tara:strand:+ start:4709 stop:5098 length:390 start_codon:yes stop_codon:yes gene_type:complete